MQRLVLPTAPPPHIHTNTNATLLNKLHLSTQQLIYQLLKNALAKILLHCLIWHIKFLSCFSLCYLINYIFIILDKRLNHASIHVNSKPGPASKKVGGKVFFASGAAKKRSTLIFSETISDELSNWTTSGHYKSRLRERETRKPE